MSRPRCVSLSEMPALQPVALDAFEHGAIGADDVLRIFSLVDTFAEIIERDEQALRVERFDVAATASSIVSPAMKRRATRRARPDVASLNRATRPPPKDKAEIVLT